MVSSDSPGVHTRPLVTPRMLLGSSSNTRARSSLRSPLAAILLVTVALSVWLAWLAFTAERHYRRAVESTLHEYAGMAAFELSRLSRESLDWYSHEVFDDIDRWRRTADPDDIDRAMQRAARRHDCACVALTDPITRFRIDYPDGSATVDPDTFDAAFVSNLSARIGAAREADTDGRGRRGILYAADPSRPGGGVATVYALRFDREGTLTTAYGFQVSGHALGDIVEHWYQNNALLPPTLGGAEANDSLLSVRVAAGPGIELFTTLDSAAPAAPAAVSGLGSTLAFDDIDVEVDIRPDAADEFVLGGLPPPRTGLFVILIAVVLGVGLFGLVQIRRERELADLRDDFLSGVSHELRTPLAQIRMFAELLTSSRLRSPEDRQRASTVIDREARRLTHLVESVLQFNRLRRIETEVSATPIDLAEAVAEVADAFQPLANDRDVEVVVSVAPKLAVAAERPGLRQIIGNLLDNALKYGPRGQTVAISAERREGRVRLRVDDQGPGVPRAERRDVWAPYVRLDRDRRTPEPGTGIGLAVVETLARRYGGSVQVLDAPGGGARFIVELPAAELDEGTPPRLHAS